MNWNRIRVLVTGGASFIGSTLVDALLARSAEVRVIDNLMNGKKENLPDHLSHGAIEFREANLLDDGVARSAVRGMDIVFHLAADHGGRGYVDLHQAACASSLARRRQLASQTASRLGAGREIHGRPARHDSLVLRDKGPHQSSGRA